MRMTKHISSGSIACLLALAACGDSTATTQGNTEGGSEGSASTGASTGTTGATQTSVTGGVTEGSNSNSETNDPTNPPPTTGDPTSASATTDGSASATTDGSASATTGTDSGVSASSGGSTTTGVVDTTGSTGDGGSSSGTTGGGGGPLPGDCVGPNMYTLDAHFDKGTLNNVNHDAPDNDQLQITVDGISAPQPYMFVAQTNDGWILKIDTATGKQLARYEAVRMADCQTCNASRTTWYPSRIIVDFDGDMYVANRAFGYQGSITKIAGQIGSCLDRNNNGQIDTSSDANGDGIVDVNDPNEFKGQADECVLYSMAVGANNTYPRALTLDGKGNAYVGTYVDQKAIKIDVSQSPPKLLKTINLPATPYGFVARGDYLYSSALGQPVMRVDLTNDTVKTMNAPGNYGITVDQNGIAWYGGSGLQRCDFNVGGNCEPKGGGGMSGVAIDAEGQVWACSGNTVYKFDNTGKQLGTAVAGNAYGVAIGHDGHPRVVGYYDAYRIDSGPVGGPPGAVTTYFTGLKNGSKPFNYTYTDFTGFGALNVTVRKGEWTVVHDGEDPNSVWFKVLWNQEKQGKVIPGTSITFQVRAAAAKDELKLKPWTAVNGTLIDGFVEGRYLEVRARLLIEDDMLDESPVLSDVCVLREGE